MKLQLDTIAKTIRIEEQVNLGEFVQQLEILLPGGKWKEFTLEVTQLINWVQPYVIPYYPITPYTPHPWWEQPWTICDGSTISIESRIYDLNVGMYNIEIT